MTNCDNEKISKYEIELYNNNNHIKKDDIFFQSLINNINGSYVVESSIYKDMNMEEQPYDNNDDDVNNNPKSVFTLCLYAERSSVYLLSSSVNNAYSYEDMEKIILDLIKQINFLERHNITFIKLDLDDILVVNRKNCIIINQSNLVEIIRTRDDYCNNNNNIKIDYPVVKNMFSSPELTNVYEIPSYISYKNIYYNIGAIIIFVYLKKNIKMDISESDLLSSIYQTKMYWFIKHCCFYKNIKNCLLKYG